MNRLVTGVKKAPNKKTKSKLSPAPPAPLDSPLGERRERIAGLEPDRYYKATEALRALKEAGKHTKNKGLMADVRKVAKHEMKSLEEIAEGES